MGGNEQVVFIVFSKNGHDKERFEFYQKNVLSPFINSLRKEYADFDVSDGMSIPDELSTVAWCDGDLPQVNAIINDHDLFTDMKVIVNKQNAARTGVEQPAVIAKVFVIFKHLNKIHTVTVTDGDPFRHLIKRRMTKAFEGNGLNELKSKFKDKKVSY